MLFFVVFLLSLSASSAFRSPCLKNCQCLEKLNLIDCSSKGLKVVPNLESLGVKRVIFKSFSLADNAISQVDIQGITSKLPNLKLLDLRRNPLNCSIFISTTTIIIFSNCVSPTGHHPTSFISSSLTTEIDKPSTIISSTTKISTTTATTPSTSSSSTPFTKNILTSTAVQYTMTNLITGSSIIPSTLNTTGTPATTSTTPYTTSTPSSTGNSSTSSIPSTPATTENPPISNITSSSSTTGTPLPRRSKPTSDLIYIYSVIGSISFIALIIIIYFITRHVWRAYHPAVRPQPIIELNTMRSLFSIASSGSSPVVSVALSSDEEVVFASTAV